MPMGVGIMIDLRGNVDVLAKTGVFHLLKEPAAAGFFGLLKRRKQSKKRWGPLTLSYYAPI